MVYTGCMGACVRGVARWRARLLSDRGTRAGGKHSREQEQPEGAASAA